MPIMEIIAVASMFQAADTLDANKVETLATEKIKNAEIVLDQSPTTDDTQIKYSETVVCVKNDMTQDDVYLVLYEMFRNSQPKNRIIKLQKNKTNCTRYDDARKIVVDFKTQAQIDAGKKSAMTSAACKRVKGGFAKYYVISQNAKGQNRCVNGDKTENTIRGYVKAARPIR